MSPKQILTNEIDNMSDAQRNHIMAVMGDLDKLNASIKQAVDSGLTIELERASRHHCGAGHWGDMMMPKVVKRA